MATPRPLQYDEIEDIVNSLPKVMSATKKTSDMIRSQIQNVLRNQLKDVKIVEAGIPKLKQYIIMQHMNSLVSPGEPVGIRAAEAIGQPTTQLALDSFHSAGKESEIGTGITSIKELYNMSQKRSMEYINLHFKNKYYTFEDVIDIRRKIVGVMASDLIYTKEYRKYNENLPPNDYWYSFYQELTNKKIPKCTTFLRIKFDRIKMYSFNLTPQDIASKIEDERITCIPSPARDGIVDFYPNDDAIIESIVKKNAELNITEENASDLFLQLIFVPNLKDVLISGIKGITQLFPVRKPVSALIRNQSKLGDNKWRVELDTIIQHIDAIPVDKLVKTMELCKIKIKERGADYFIVEMPEKNTIQTDLLINDEQQILQANSPQMLINMIVNNDNKSTNTKTEEEKRKGIFKRQDISVVGRNAYYLCGLTNGTNLIDVLANPLVDSRYTRSNNPHEVIKALGVEAARNFLILEYIRNFGDKVEPRHIMLCVDFQTSLGILLPITSRGAARQQTGPLAKGSFEHAMSAFLEAAAFGKFEEVKSTSTSIFVGKRMILGTGSFKARIDKEALDKADAERARRTAIRQPERLNTLQVQAMTSDFNIEGDMLNPNEDMIGEFPVTEEIGTNMKIEKLKIKSTVPVVKPSGLELPMIVNAILRKAYINEKEIVLPTIPSKALSPKRQTLSKPGLPAIPEMTPTQILVSPNARRTAKVNLDSFLDEDF